MKTPWSTEPEELGTHDVEHVEAVHDAGALSNEELSREFFDLHNACTYAMEHVRLKISHNGQFRLFTVRADDADAHTGEFVLSDGSRVKVEAWGVPGPKEDVVAASWVRSQIIAYIRSLGLTIPV